MKIEVSHRPWFQIPSCLTYSFLALGGSWCSWHIHHPPSQSFVHSDPNVILGFSLGKFFPISKFGSSLPSTGSRLTKIKQTECFSSLFKSLWKYLCPTLFSVLFYFFQNDWFCISKFITTIKYKEEYNWHPFFFFSLCLPPSLHSLWPNPPQCCELLRGWKNFYSSSCSLLCPAQLLAHRKHSANVLWIIAFTRDGPILGQSTEISIIWTYGPYLDKTGT